jgi:hypothetical protein
MMDITVDRFEPRTSSALPRIVAICVATSVFVCGAVWAGAGKRADLHMATASASAERTIEPAVRGVASNELVASQEPRRVASVPRPIDNSRECDAEKGITDSCVY